MTTTTATAAREFLAALFAGARGVIELRAFPSKARRFALLGQFETLRDFFAVHGLEEEVYVGVAARRDTRSGKLKNCSTLGAIFADIDFKLISESEARRRLETCRLRPSLLVRTGHGWHVYWLLREPLDLQDPVQLAQARSLLERLVVAFGADPSAAEPARCLRIPETWNHKDATPSRVDLELCDPTRRYNASELDEWLPSATSAAAPHAASPPGSLLGPLAPAVAGCDFLRWARDHQAQVSEPLWYALLTNLVRLEGGRDAGHAFSCQHPTYDVEETDDKLDHATTAPGPISCKKIQELGFTGCPKEGHGVQAPAWLSWPEKERRGHPAAPPTSANGQPRATDPEVPGSPEPDWPTLAPEALYGLAGRVVAAIDPFTEADPVATLATFLVAVGNLVGAGPHAQAGEDPHPGRQYAALVGESAKGRKGMSWRPVRRLLGAVDDVWARTRIASGLSSGEGVIYHVRDPREERQPVKERGRVVDYQTVVVDQGVEDKRLLVEEPELASVLRRMDRESNSLSAVLRQAWDDGHLGTLTKNSPLRATGAHVSLLAHVTRTELIANLGATERVNGFANRFLYLLVRRSKELPDPLPIPPAVLSPLVQELTAIVAWAQGVDRLTRDPLAQEAWRAIYSTLSAGRPGLLGAITNRAEAHTLRLSVLYALLDRSAVIRLEHLQAGLALWGYAETSARLIFGTRTGDPIADTLESALRERGPLTRTEIRDLFHRNVSEDRIEAALRALTATGRIRQGPPRATGGRPAETWEATR